MLTLISWVHGWLVRIILAILAAGPVPQNVGFVMDGNRRYARQRGQKVLQGHGQGLESLKGALDMCLHLGVKTVSVYAFAIDNFNRPKEEVEGLMTMAHDSLLKLCEQGELLSRHSIKVNFIGRRDLLTPQILETVQLIEQRTRNHEHLTLYICSPYSSRDEVTAAVRSTIERVERGELFKSDITSDLLKSALPSGPSLELLIRTSDVHRLSDFQLWQCAKGTQIHFVKAFWPDFGVREMLSVVLRWQRRCFIERYWDSS